MLAISFLSGLAFILIFTMICTFPSWITGKIKARKSPGMNLRFTTPGRGQNFVRWALLLTSGFLTLSFFAVATGFNTQAGYNGNFLPVIMAGIVSAAFAATSQYFAFAIGFTKATTAIARRKFEKIDTYAAVDSENYEATPTTVALPVTA